MFGSKSLKPAEAMIYTMTIASAADGEIDDAELQMLNHIIGYFLAVNRSAEKQFDRKHPREMVSDCLGAIRSQGVERVTETIAEGLPAHLRPTAYAFAAEIVLSDGIIKDEELAVLNMFAQYFGIDPDVAKAVEISACARWAPSPQPAATRDAAQQPSAENSLSPTAVSSERLGSVGTEIMSFLMSHYRNERGIHAETIIGAAAAVTGDLALRSSETELPDHGWVMSSAADRILFENEGRGELCAWPLIRQAAMNAGAAQGDLPDPAEVTARTAAAVGGSPFPPISVPQQNYPHEWSPNAAPRLRAEILRIGQTHGLTMTETTLAAALALSHLISQTKDVLPPATGATLALEVMIGVSRMVLNEVQE